MFALSILLSGVIGLAFAEETDIQRLSRVYLEDNAQTVKLASELLAAPSRLSPSDGLMAQAYRCEALTQLGRLDEAIQLTSDASAALPSELTAEQTEPAARLLSCIGYIRKQKGQFAQSLADFNRALGWLAQHPQDLTESYLRYRRAGLYDALGNYADAMADLTRALDVLSDVADGQDTIAQRNNITSAIARIQLHRHEYDRALPQYESLLAYARLINDAQAEAVVELNLGDCFRGMERWSEAEDSYTRALTIASQQNIRSLIARAYAGLGETALARQEYASGFKQLALAREEFVSAGNVIEINNIDLARARALAQTRNWAPLRRLCLEMLQRVKDLPDKHVQQQVYELLAHADEESHDLASALNDLRASMHIKDEIQEHELSDELAKQSVRFDVAQLESKSRALASENAVAQRELGRVHEINILQRWILALAILGGALLVINLKRFWNERRHLTQIANEDVLTGLFSRRATLAAANRAFSQARKANHPLSVVLIDVDHFKQINDTFGHLAGDQVLKCIASCLRGVLRSSDICGRVGGDEFLIVLPHLTLISLQPILIRARESIKDLQCETLPSECRTTISCGCAEQSENDADFDALLLRADDALYESKNAGRNRVTTATQRSMRGAPDDLSLRCLSE